MSTKELYDKSFTYPIVRNYEFSEESLAELEHFEDNLNKNPNNSLALTRFIEVAQKVRSGLSLKYG